MSRDRFAALVLGGIMAASVAMAPVASASAAPSAPAPGAYKADPLPPDSLGTAPEDGIALPPAAGAGGVDRRKDDMEARSAAVARAQLGAYNKTNYTPRPLTGTSLPYNSPTLYGDRGVPRDETGVRMFPISGVLYDHPVAQAQDGLYGLSDHSLTGEAQYLDRAVVNAQRLIDRHVLVEDAWYYPYPFDFLLHGRSDFAMRAPWFSGMAQGQVLSLFTRLHEVTGDQKWLDAAVATFNSFRYAPTSDLPSTVNIDSAGYLWLEEYPRWPTSESDRTLNGHIFSAFGLYDYHMLTGDPLARDLWNGALANTRWYLPNGFRNPNYASFYCLAHGITPGLYHEIHQEQMLYLHAGTGDHVWAQYADTLRTDYPPPAVTGTVMFEPGSHTTYKFTGGTITATKTVSFSQRSSAPADQRARVVGRGIYYRITAGTFAGYWVPEDFQRAWMAGQRVTVVYPLARTALIPAGSWSAYRYSATGERTASKTIQPTRTTSAPFSTSAVINGRFHVLITAGSLANYWLPAAAMTLN